MSIQNIMNVCFAICITFLIFQNQQLKDQVDTLEGFDRYSFKEAVVGIIEDCSLDGTVDVFIGKPDGYRKASAKLDSGKISCMSR